MDGAAARKDATWADPLLSLQKGTADDELEKLRKEGDCCKVVSVCSIML